MHKCAALLFVIATGCSQASSPTDTPPPATSDAGEATRSIAEGIPELSAGEIYYQRTGCFGACPVFSFVIRPDGRGLYTGARFVKHEGEYPFTVSPDEYEWFKASLEAYRTEGERDYGEDNCPFGPVATDGSSVRVSWGGQ
ncbi:MAG: DUF6438 domain-containing protein [Pseudomonadota bacterium]